MPDLARFRAIHGAVDEHSLPSTASILHVDMDAFFVSVELLERPELRGKPVIVGGGSPDQRGVVTSASYEARKFGVHSAMPLRTAGKLCPHGIFLDGHHHKYSEWSDRVATILGKFSPIVEMVSIDEAYLDLAGTERLHGPPFAAADKLLRMITSTTGLPCSGGLGSTRLVAKVGSEQAKPRGLVWVPPGSEARFLAPLPVRKIPGIGEVTERSLLALGLKTVGELADVPHEKLQKIFGQWGTALYRKARGGDSYEFVIDAEPKSISHNHTFGEDTSDGEVLLSMLSHLSQKACKRLREAGLSTRTLTLTIRYQGFDTYTRAKTLAAPTNLDSDIFATIQSLFHEHRNPRRKVRLLGVALGSFSHGNDQLDLLESEKRAKLEKLAKTTDGLRDRFGFDSVQFGGSIRHEARNSNEGWGLRETRRKNEAEDEKSERKARKTQANESDFYPD
jgi:DNA polymerase IV